jgi:phosphoenolpyruvate synthase/pyruvate phosphate dikinase
VRVPDFFVITSDTFALFLSEAKKNSSNISSLDLIRRFEFPKEFISELNSAADALSGELFAVRSSADVEDGKNRSYAGQFDTLLSVTKDSLAEAVRSVWLSSYTPKGESAYFTGEASPISVIVQRQITPDYAGVCFSSSPASVERVLIEYVEGLGEKLVSGEKKPIKIEAEKTATLENELFEELKNTAVRLEKSIGYPLDFEFAISDGKLWFLQMRPLTVSSFSSYALPDGNYSMYVKRDFPWYIHSVQIKASLPEEQFESYGFSTPIFEGALIFGEEYYSERSDGLTKEIFDRLSTRDFELFERKISKKSRKN